MSGIELVCRRRGSTLVPVAQTFEEDLLTVPEGKDVMVRVTMARNPLQDAAYWSAVGDLLKGGVWNGTKDSLSRFFKLSLGYTEEVIGGLEPVNIPVTDAMLWAAREVCELTIEALRPIIEAAIAAAEPQAKIYHVIQSLSPASMDGIAFTEFFKRVEELVASKFGVDISRFHPAEKRKYALPAADGLPAESGRGGGEEAAAMPGPASSALALQDYAALAATATTLGELMAVGQKLLQTHPNYREDGRGKSRLAIYNLHLRRILEPEKVVISFMESEIADLLAESAPDTKEGT